MKPLRPSPQLHAELERCWPWLWASLCEFGPTHSKAQVLTRLLNYQAYLWPGKRCAIITELVDYPIGMRACNYWLQGGELEEIKTFHPAIEEWALACGCHQTTRRGREGWVRAMHGMQKGPTFSMKWLRAPPEQVQRARAARH